MPTSSVALYNTNDPYEQFIASIISVERAPQDRLQTNQAAQTRLRSVMNDLDSKVSALNTLVEQFTDPLASPFDARSATVPSSGTFTASAGDSAAFGSHTLQIDRLARTDTRISNQRVATATTLSSFFASNGGTQSFTIQVAAPTEADPNNRADIAVSVTPTGTTDKEILGEIATAINTAMDQAVADGTITSSQASHSAVVNETSDTARLSIRSGQTGFTNRLQFVDSAAGLLSTLEVNSGVVASGTAGGQVISVGTSEIDSELNSKFQLDGLTLYRSSNSVSDALDGVTLSLSKISTAAEEFSVEPGGSSIKSQVADFIAKYNDVLTYIAGKSSIDTATFTRGDFANDRAFTSLRYALRNDVARQVTGQPAGAPSWLADLGITMSDDGTLTLGDSDKLLAAVKENSAAVQNFFAGTDGLASRVQSALSTYVGASGLISARKNSLDDRIDRLDDQIKAWDTRLSQREVLLRQKFAQLQSSITMYQGQQQTFLSYFNGAQ